jgi:hypothetical protein
LHDTHGSDSEVLFQVGRKTEFDVVVVRDFYYNATPKAKREYGEATYVIRQEFGKRGTDFILNGTAQPEQFD